MATKAYQVEKKLRLKKYKDLKVQYNLEVPLNVFLTYLITLVVVHASARLAIGEQVQTYVFISAI